jgi:multidrug resistance efflux pump
MSRLTRALKSLLSSGAATKETTEIIAEAVAQALASYKATEIAQRQSIKALLVEIRDLLK